MQEVATRIGKEGRLVIPAKMRRALGVTAGSALILRLDKEGLHVYTPEQALARAQKLVQRYVSPGTSLSADLIADRRAEEAGDE